MPIKIVSTKTCGDEVALDTNRYVDLCKGEPETLELLEQAEAIMLPFVVVAEPRAGSALVLQHNLVLHARDRHFDHLPQIVRT